MNNQTYVFVAYIHMISDNSYVFVNLLPKYFDLYQKSLEFHLAVKNSDISNSDIWELGNVVG